MISDSQLNVYIVGVPQLSPRLKERLQAQVQSALRDLPPWIFTLLRLRLSKLGLRNFPLIVKPQLQGQADAEPLSVGYLGDKPAAYLSPLARGQEIDWRQERRHLLAKALAYLCAPRPAEDAPFWQRWRRAMEEDGLLQLAQDADPQWAKAQPLDLLMEMFAAHALSPEHPRWQELPAVRRFLDGWKATATG